MGDGFAAEADLRAILPFPISEKSLSLRQVIGAKLGPQALLRPAFYRNPGGLRFELSTGGSAVEQFLTAFRKAHAICSEVFKTTPSFAICMSVHLYKPAFSFRDDLRSLKRAGIRIPRTKEMWVTGGEDEGDVLLHTAFVADRTLLDSALWCALGADLNIAPCPKLSAIRLINMEQAVLVHPYDDRGMDIVGSSRELLSELYSKFNAELLDYDRAAMNATFG